MGAMGVERLLLTLAIALLESLVVLDASVFSVRLGFSLFEVQAVDRLELV